MLYALLKLIVKIALRVFYKDIYVEIKGKIPAKGPLIVVSNHPNTFMDPIVIASVLPQQVYFLTNGSVFKNPVVAWLLSRMHMIPIYRKEDVNGQAPDNRTAFARCFDFLANKGTLLIFPEGSSIHERRLRKLKTGTARIALGAEAEHNFTLGVQILTVGLNYSDPVRFRSELFVQIDSPIQVSKYASAYLQDPVETVNALTEEIRVRLENHIIVTKNTEEDALVQNIETVYKSKLVQELGINGEEPEEEFGLTKNIIEAIRYFEERHPQQVQELQVKLADYRQQLAQLKLKEEALGQKQKYSSYSLIQTGIYLVVCFPVYMYGLLNNYIPYIIPSKVARLLTKDEVYIAPIMMTTGIFSFSLCYTLQILVFHQLTGQLTWLTCLYAISLPVTGFLVLHYWNSLTTYYHHWTFVSLFQSRKEQIAALIRSRVAIIRELDNARKEYSAYAAKNSRLKVK